MASGSWQFAFNAPADALLSNGDPNPNATNVAQAFQSMADAGGYLSVPAGNYFIDVPDNCIASVHLTKTVQWDFAQGAVLYVRGSVDPTKWSDVLLIEDPMFSGHILNGLDIRPFAGAAQACRAYVVVHSAYVRIIPRALLGAGKWGVIGESGFAQNMEAGTFLPNGSYINANFGTIDGGPGRGLVQSCGKGPVYPYTGSNIEYDPDGGAGVYVHGSDTNGWVISRLLTAYCNAGYDDATLAGCTFMDCYGEVNRTYAHFRSSGGSEVRRGQTEDFNLPVRTGVGWTSFGGTVVGNTNFGYFARFTAGDGTGANAVYWESPNAGANYAWSFGRGQPGNADKITWSYAGHRWGYVYNQIVGPVPGWSGTPPIQITEDDPRGPCLAVISRPLLNSAKRWSWRQTSVTIPANSYLRCQMAANWAGRLSLAATDPTLYAPNDGLQGVDVKVSINVEPHTTKPDPTVTLSDNDAATLIAARAALLDSAKVRVGLVVPLAQDVTGGIWAVQLWNDDSQDIVVDVLWQFELFQLSTSANSAP